VIGHTGGSTLAGGVGLVQGLGVVHLIRTGGSVIVKVLGAKCALALLDLLLELPLELLLDLLLRLLRQLLRTMQRLSHQPRRRNHAHILGRSRQRASCATSTCAGDAVPGLNVAVAVVRQALPWHRGAALVALSPGGLSPNNPRRRRGGVGQNGVVKTKTAG
jgi:hypothetical protein